MHLRVVGTISAIVFFYFLRGIQTVHLRVVGTDLSFYFVNISLFGMWEGR